METTSATKPDTTQGAPSAKLSESAGIPRAKVMMNFGAAGLAVLLSIAAISAATPERSSLRSSADLVPETPKQFFNLGTQVFKTGKLNESEALLEMALASQDERLQPKAVYNLGHVRFNQGIQELKKGPGARETLNRGNRSAALADSALQAADESLRANDVQLMLIAYLRGRGARKDVRAAAKAVQQAMEAHRAGLLKWQRASGDFHSAAELQPSNADARHNAEVVDRHIAKLIDSLQQLQEMASMLGEKSDELRQKLQQLRGKIPAHMMPPGAAGDEEDEEEEPSQPDAGQQEAPSRDGQQIELSPEQAAWLLEGFKLDRERRLPMGQGQQSEPRPQNRQDW